MKKVSFEAAISELEEIVRQLEGGNEPLESSLKLFEKGAKLASYCYSALDKAEQKVTELSKLENSETEGEPDADQQ
ncbi:MAG: exodeoxyribonuclease VII small subunit [Clostridiales bacterium]|jgi:exodeoxyribonuclease VII small subunit|nr:exodeoxyribonuclease VII small subunit [Clostridiales bacterium]